MQTLSRHLALYIQLADPIICPYLDTREMSCIYIVPLHQGANKHVQGDILKGCSLINLELKELQAFSCTQNLANLSLPPIKR